jgi:thioredoxin 2
MADSAVVVVLTDPDLAGAIAQAELPLLVDFYSPACGPCRMLAPTLEALAKRYFGRAILAKIDVTTNPAAARRYGIRGVPTLLFFEKGRLIDQISGALPERELAGRIDALLRT